MNTFFIAGYLQDLSNMILLLDAFRTKVDMNFITGAFRIKI